MRIRIQASARYILFNILLILFIVGPLGAQIGQAATYYVGKAGTNNNTCTQAKSQSTPKLSIRSGIGCLSPGDTLVVKAGTYLEIIAWNVFDIPSGTEGNPITIMADPNDTVTIKAPIGTEDNLSLIHFYTQSYMIVKGFILDASNEVNGTVSIEWPSDNVRIENNQIINAIFNGIGVFASDSVVINNNIYMNGFSATYGAGGAWGYGAYVTGANNLIEGNDIHDNSRYGVHLYSQIGTVNNNIIRNNKIYDNTIEANGAGILMGGADNQVYNNVISNHQGHGIELNYSGPVNTKIYHNTIYGSSQYGIVIGTDEGAFNTIIRNNLIINSGYGTFDNAGTQSIMSNNLTSNPGFTNAPSDFHLNSATGPAIGTGMSLVGIVDTDADGVARGTAFDLGAYEYAAGGPSPSAPGSPKNVKIVP